MGDLTTSIILYKSTNQGAKWTEIFELPFNSEQGIYNRYKCKIVDSNHIYLNKTDRMAIEKTTDGGKTFNTVLFGDISNEENEHLFDIAMYNSKRGVAVSRSYLVFTDDNWGSNTIVTLPDSVHSKVPIFFIDSRNIVFNRYDGYNVDFIRYDIINKKWSIWGRGEKKETEYKNINTISFVNDSVWYGCGLEFTGDQHYSKDIIWKSTDKGKTWEKILDKLNDPGFGTVDLAFRNELHGIAVGSWGKIIETTDGGESWFQYPIKQERGTSGPLVTWAGTIPIITSDSRGIFRLETLTDAEELSSDQKFRVYQTGKNLEIAINDESHSTYSFQLFNSSGQQLLTRSVKSSYGFVFEPVPLIDLPNGVYYYTLSHNNSVEFSGKLVVVE